MSSTSRIVKNTVKLSLLISSSVLLSACADNLYGSNTAQRYASARTTSAAMVSTETLLNAGGLTLSSGQSQQGAYDPAALHAQARKRVKTNQTRGTLAYTTHPRHRDIVAPKQYRVVELKDDSTLFDGAFTLASATLRPADPATIKPSRKPVFGQKAAPQPAKAIQVAAIAPLIAKPIISLVPGITNLRMGDYEDKTRLVLDLNMAAKYDYAFSDLDNKLTVHVDGAGWNLESRKYFDNHPLIKSYEIEENSKNDVMLHIALKKPSKMLMSGFVRPDDNNGHRIFFDVAAL